MKSVEIKKYLRNIFLPFAGILGLMQTATFTLKMLSQTLVATHLISNSALSVIPFLKIGIAIPGFVLTIIFVILAHKIPIQRLFSICTKVLIATAVLGLMIPSLYNFLIVDHRINEIQQASNYQHVYQYVIAQMFRHWPITLFYSLTSFFHSSIAILIWGMLNQITKRFEAFHYYIPLTFISNLLMMPFLLAPLLFKNLMSQMYTCPIILSIVCFLLSFYLFKHVLKKIEAENVDQEQKTQLINYKSTILALGFLIASFGTASFFFNLIFKNQLKRLYSSPSDYFVLFGQYSFIIGIGTLVIAALLSLVGSRILKKKGWTSTVIMGTVSCIIISIFVVGYTLLVGSKPVTIFPQTLFLQGKYPLLGIGSTCQILLKGISTSLIFPLVQVVYLTLPNTSRFKVKVWTEVVVVKIMNMGGTSIAQIMLVIFGSLSQISLYIGLFSIFILICALMVSKKIGLQKGIDREIPLFTP